MILLYFDASTFERGIATHHLDEGTDETVLNAIAAEFLKFTRHSLQTKETLLYASEDIYFDASTYERGIATHRLDEGTDETVLNASAAEVMKLTRHSLQMKDTLSYAFEDIYSILTPPLMEGGLQHSIWMKELMKLF